MFSRQQGGLLRGTPFRSSATAAGVSSCSRVAIAARLENKCAQSSSTIPAVVGQTCGLSRRALLGLTSLGLASGTLQQRGIAMASTSAAASEMEKVLLDPKWPERWPFRPEFFSRYDESDDATFYEPTRLVTHIDDYAIAALTKYYEDVFPKDPSASILDICSSWVSHYPPGLKAARVAGLGMNGEELKANKQLTEWVVKDLNKQPVLPYEDNSFDVITNCVSVDYLNKPMEVFKEMHRCLKPGGLALMSFSNRCFPTKAIQLWTNTGDADHIWIVASYFHYSVPGGWTEPRCADITPKLSMRTDPMYVVYARKQAA